MYIDMYIYNFKYIYISKGNTSIVGEPHYKSRFLAFALIPRNQQENTSVNVCGSEAQRGAGKIAGILIVELWQKISCSGHVAEWLALRTAIRKTRVEILTYQIIEN